MKTLVIILMMFAGVVGKSICQQSQIDTSKEALPPLELPEITIVGKKAITLPFARKGEKYDVTVYQAMPPDSSLIGERQDISFLPASIPDYKERRKQWHLSFDGYAGSIGSAGLHSYITYDNETWKFDGRAGLSGMKGHVYNADASGGMIGVDAGTLLKTDNNILKTLVVSLGTQFSRESYGMFGIPAPSINRARNTWKTSVNVHSLDRLDNVLDVGFQISSLSLTDRAASTDSNVTSLAPGISASFMKSIKNVDVTAAISYMSSSVDYSSHSQNPSLFLFNTYAQWKLNNNWTVSAGGLIGNGSGNTTLVSPVANARWSVSSRSSWEFWLRPQINLVTYDENISQNPYLIREMLLQPERAPLNIGTTYSVQMNSLMMDVSASFTQFSDKRIVVADSGIIHLEYVKANQIKFEFNGTMNLMSNMNMNVHAVVQPSFEDGRNVQLPMVPLVKFHARSEYTFGMPLTAWASLEYSSRQHADRQGLRELTVPFILNSGVSSTILREIILSFEVSNLLNTGYEWWSGYPAPGREFRLQARMNIL